MLYGSECWPMHKNHGRQLHSAEMTMLRWACGWTRLDRLHDVIRERFGIPPIADKCAKPVSDDTVMFFAELDVIGKRPTYLKPVNIYLDQAFNREAHQNGGPRQQAGQTLMNEKRQI
ncbi:hypothetical protein TELCIR_07423 [Teladorsagia circumcincta]|uniref:Uncharacterized protein n=1 Tax=Teladorsagia circumcincta TaxID=45464 RepID=A0A2G9UKP8_TELCI|nr:hypothetical protein TELCIR_07423 [Teladorsagia circumcincta]